MTACPRCGYHIKGGYLSTPDGGRMGCTPEDHDPWHDTPTPAPPPAVIELIRRAT